MWDLGSLGKTPVEGMGIMAQWVKMLPAKLASHIRMAVGVPGTL